MSYPMAMNLNQKQKQSVKQLQRLIMSHQMQQAIHILQMPLLELSTVIEGEMEQNPILEYSEEELPPVDRQEEQSEESQESELVPEKELLFSEKDFEVLRKIDEEFREHLLENDHFVPRTSEQEKRQAFLESTICAQPSLFDHLMRQAKETLSSSQEISMAEFLVGNLDERGFLGIPLEEIAILNNFELQKLQKVLEVIQTFHPCGIAAPNLRTSLLLQLKFKGKTDSLAYHIIENYFEDLLHNRIRTMQKNLNCSPEEMRRAIDEDIARLDLHPGAGFSSQITPYITAEASIKIDNDQLIVEMSEESIPALRLNSRYLKMLHDETLGDETKEFIRQKIISAKWLLRNLLQRSDTIERIAQALAIRQRDFFLNPKGELVPLTMKTLADDLHVHESTIARAVSNKYINTPKGLLPIRFFFTSSLSAKNGEEISSSTARDVLSHLIEKEDKHRPHSDETLSSLLKEKGIHCARRTVAKYRALLNIGNAQQRKKF